MAVLEETPRTALRLLEPDSSLKRAWHLLGYRRYIHRSALHKEAADAGASEPQPQALQQAGSTAAVPQPEKPAAIPSFAEIAEKEVSAAAVKDMPHHSPVLPLRRGEVTIIDHCGFTFFYNAAAALCLPPLQPVDGHFRVFRDEAEYQFLQNALQVMQLPMLAALLAGLDAPFAAPRFSAGETLLKEWQAAGGKTVVIMGRFTALQSAVRTAAGQEICCLPCTHPAIAMQSGIQKKRLWLDLLTIKENFNA